MTTTMIFKHDDLHVLEYIIFAMSFSHDTYCQQEAIMSNSLRFKHAMVSSCVVPEPPKIF